MAKTIKVIGCAMGSITLALLGFLLLSGTGSQQQQQQQQQQQREEQQNDIEKEFHKTAPAATNLSALWQNRHRQKRYLQFPSGSSFQLVFDLIIPIVDYTNFAIMGITCAVAWELPSKPPSELIEHVRTRLNDGTLGVVRRNDSAPTDYSYDYSSTEQSRLTNPIPMPATGSSTDAASANWHAWHGWQAKPPAWAPAWAQPSASTTYAGGPSAAATSGYVHGNANAQQQPANWHARQSARIGQRPGWSVATPPHRQNNNWWLRNKARIEQNWRQKQRLWSAYESPTRYGSHQRKLLQQPPSHHIYPVFGKRRRRRRRLRNAETDLDAALEQLHFRTHLSSREQLFRKIERLYNARQLNGTACVLRALCESAQRLGLGNGMAKASAPQSFIMELLSAIFQLPTGDDAVDFDVGVDVNTEATNHISARYRDAHSQLGNCRRVYSDCSHGFWLN